MESSGAARTVGAARIFMQRPERLAALWRKERSSLPHVGAQVPLLDGVVEGFIRELGATLAGAKGHPWESTRGVLRLSSARGPRALFEEFASLRRCILDALDALGADVGERRTVNAAIDDAVDSSVALLRGLEDDAPVAQNDDSHVTFGGLVVELFERTQENRARRPTPLPGEQTDAMH